MRLFFKSLAVAGCLLPLAACAADTSDETSSSSEAYSNHPPVAGYAYVPAEQYKFPAPKSASNPKIGSVNENTKLIVYCKVHDATTDTTWLESNIHSDFGLSY